MIYHIIGYILLPFYAIYCWIKDSTEYMDETQKILFYGLLFIVIMLLIDVIKAL